MPIVDEYTRQCLSILVDRNIDSEKVKAEVLRLSEIHGFPNNIRSDNGKEYTSKVLAEEFSERNVN